jgi:hypothetical protein
MESIVCNEEDRYQVRSGNMEIHSYDDLIISADFHIFFSVSIGSYQGDLFYLVLKDDRFYYIHTGFGSCSGCDAYEACSSAQDYEELRQSLIPREVGKTKQEMLTWLQTHDWEGDYSGETTRTEFAEPAITQLKNFEDGEWSIFSKLSERV